jgi:hypothetical protein
VVGETRERDESDNTIFVHILDTIVLSSYITFYSQSRQVRGKTVARKSHSQVPKPTPLHLVVHLGEKFDLFYHGGQTAE